MTILSRGFVGNESRCPSVVFFFFSTGGLGKLLEIQSSGNF